MPETRVTSLADLARPLGEAWAVARDFARPWHPWVRDMRAEHDARGSLLRRFRVDDQEYVETQSYFSDSDHVLGYRALEGIDGARAYRAELRLSGNGSTRAEWSAEISAPDPRLGEIADGTRAVFDAGLDALASVPAPEPVRATAPVALAEIRRETVPGAVRLSCLVAGPAGGTTLCLFLHGIGGQASNWEPQLARIGARWPAVALDLRGYGRSAPGSAPTTIEDYCADILTVADHFKAEKLVLAGLSYGAWIATSFAMRHPDRLAALVLADGCTGMSEASPAEQAAFRAAREAPLDAGQTPADFAPGVVDIIAGPNAGAELREVLRASMAAIPAATYRDALTCFTNPPERFDFSRIACPVLLMTGEHDVLAPPDEIRAISRRMLAAQPAPDIRFEVIAGAGHLSNLEAPEAFTAPILDLLERVAPVAPATTGKQRRRAAKHARILEAALAEFARNGFSGTSMQAIASRAGVSKPTLYQYFGNKQDLLAAVLDVGKSELLAPLEAADGAALVPVLWRYAWTYADFVLRPDMLSLARLIIGEAERLPEVAHDYQQAGPKQALEGMKAFLCAQKARGALAFEDAELAAENLWALILSAPREHALHHPEDPPERARIARHIENGLAVFLAAFSTDPARHRAELQRLCAPHETGTGHGNGKTA